MTLIIVSIVSIAFGLFFFWIDMERCILFPALFLLSYSIDYTIRLATLFSGPNVLKSYTTTIAWLAVLLGIGILVWSAGGEVGIIIAITGIINTLAYGYAYYHDFNDGKTTFLCGHYAVLLGCTLLYYHVGGMHLDRRLSGIILWNALVYQLLHVLHPSTTEDSIFGYNKEYSIHGVSYTIIYWLTIHAGWAIVFIGRLFYNTLLIAGQHIRGNKASILSDEQNKKLTGRDILAGQKVLDRQSAHTKTSEDLHRYKQWQQYGILPSQWMIQQLHIWHIISIILFMISMTMTIIHDHHRQSILLYRLGIILFAITMVTDRHHPDHGLYTKTTIILTSSAFLLHVFIADSIPLGAIILGAILWNSAHYLLCIFYQSVETLAYLSTSDRRLRVINNAIVSIIIIAYMTQLSLAGQVIFALCCMYGGASMFASYQAWKGIENK